ncbi:MAG: ABC transporter permease, partial [archaeon]|nr:ABC transporter permease [archaeon]
FLRFPTQMIVQPLISAVLFLVIFGQFIGAGFEMGPGITFIAFIVPGITVLNMITSAYSNSAYSLFMMRFLNFIADILVAPISYAEMVLAFTIGSTLRGMFIATIILIVSSLFTPISIHDPLLFAYFLAGISFLFGSLGIIIGLWAKEFEQVELLTMFVLTPLTFLGGVFHSIQAMPPVLQLVSQFNPFFHIINGFRYSVIGISEGNLLVAIIMVLFGCITLFALNLYLFKKGWHLRS